MELLLGCESISCCTAKLKERIRIIIHFIAKLGMSGFKANLFIAISCQHFIVSRRIEAVVYTLTIQKFASTRVPFKGKNEATRILFLSKY